MRARSCPCCLSSSISSRALSAAAIGFATIDDELNDMGLCKFVFWIAATGPPFVDQPRKEEAAQSRLLLGVEVHRFSLVD
jgi:hypothetical protein